MVYVGVDGCKLGWLSVVLDTDGKWEVDAFRTINSLWNHYKTVELILIDIPIGLRESGTKERICDIEARKLIGARRSSVFPVPCRGAVYAAYKEEATEVNQLNTGRALSRQVFGIIRKIKEVDQLLLSDITAKSRIREIHPEVCFWTLNKRKPMEYNKKKQKGFEERILVLRSVYPYTDDIVAYALQQNRPKEVAKDDILDALVAAVTASKMEQGLSTIPETPESDSKGLPMEMVYLDSINHWRL